MSFQNIKSHEKACENKNFCGIIMSSKKDNILEFNQYIESDKMPYLIYTDMEPLIKKIDGCINNPETSLTVKIGQHFPCRYSMPIIWTLVHIENKHILYRFLMFFRRKNI